MNTVYENHLYVILYPNMALVASQLPAEAFARHYTVGSARHYDGKVIFAEIDLSFRNSYFAIDEVLDNLAPHDNGRPHATKFICSYRVLEHLDFTAIRRLYLTNPDGTSLGLDSVNYDKTHEPDFLRVIAEIDPLRMLVLTSYDFSQYGKWITDPKNTKGAPRVLYTQFDLNIKEFLKDFEENPLMHPPLPSLHPSKLRDAISELQTNKNKHTKGMGLDCNLNKKSYARIRHGFMFASQEQELFFPMPAPDEIESLNYRFWKGMN